MTWMNHQKTVEIKNFAAQKHEKICYLILSTLDIVNLNYISTHSEKDRTRYVEVKLGIPVLYTVGQ